MPHYRYRRYLEMLSVYEPSNAQVALVDLGCGAGVFSWVFLDWARLTNRPLDGLSLYGFDHSPAMLRMAQKTRDYIRPHVPGYPELRTSTTPDGLCDLLTKNHTPGTSYLITLGHVLVQSHAPGDLQGFSRIITHVISLPNRPSTTELLAVDARNEGDMFAEGWKLLADGLVQAGIRCEEFPVRTSAINNNRGAKRARLKLES